MNFLQSIPTTILILLNAGYFLLEAKDGGSTNTSVALKYGAMYTPYVKRGEYYWLLTSMFMHFGAYHLLFNMYALSILGPPVDYVCGSVRFLIIYLLSGIAGNAATMLVEERSGRYRISAGASGSVFGLLGACFVLAVAGYGFSLRSIMTTLVINLAYGFMSRRINMVAHAGGFVGGAAVMAVMLMLL